MRKIFLKRIFCLFKKVSRDDQCIQQNCTRKVKCLAWDANLIRQYFQAANDGWYWILREAWCIVVKHQDAGTLGAKPLIIVRNSNCVPARRCAESTWYSGSWYQAWARASDGNFQRIMRPGLGERPSRVTAASSKVMNFPPYFFRRGKKPFSYWR